jgi:cytosine/adenosine deaminase-related metal-dependent hydrolase
VVMPGLINAHTHAPMTLLPGLVLTDGSGRPTPEAEAVLRGGSALALAGERRHASRSGSLGSSLR